MGDPLAASARINEMIASAIRVNPEWFWKNVRAMIERKSHPGAEAQLALLLRLACTEKIAVDNSDFGA